MPYLRVDGASGTPGQNPDQLHGAQGGSIDIKLSEQDKTIRVEGTHTTSFAFADTLSLSARGGDGAAGKIGADGTPGERGRDGTNATQFTKGTDGGPGTSGGHGAPGGNGGNAGSGGQITATVTANDLALLAAIDNVTVSAGTPGRAGRHGKGGAGGPGGRGGSSYTWQEPYTDYETQLVPSVHHHHGHHHHGHHHHVSYHTTMVPVTRYRPHTTSGGRNGDKGPQGGCYTTPLYAGEAGVAGKVTWQVLQEDGNVTRYPSRFGINLQPVSFATSENKGMYEPWEPIEAHYQIYNPSPDMPTPPEGIPVVLQAVPGLQVTQCAMVWGNLPPQMTGQNTYPARFHVEGPQSHDQSAPWSRTVAINATAHNTRLEKPYPLPAAESRQTITVRYPIELRPKPTHFAISNDETLTLEAEVYNIANRALGNLSGRNVLVEFVCPESSSEKVPSIEYIQEISPLTSHTATRSFRFTEETDDGATQTFQTKLYLQSYVDPQQMTLIQQQNITVQLTPKYQPPAPGGFLLVMNAETPLAVFAAWRSLLAQMASDGGVAVWNATYYSGFAPERVPDGYGQDLLSLASQRTVVILDNPRRPAPGAAPIRDTSSFTSALIERANRDEHASVVAVSDTAVPNATGALPVIAPNFNGFQHRSIDMLVHTLFTDRDSLINDYALTLPRQTRGCWPFTSRRSSQEETQSLNQLLLALFPHRRYQVTCHHSTATDLSITVHRLRDPYRCNGMHQVSPNLANEFTTARTQMLAMMPFAQKLQLFARTTAENWQPIAEALKEDVLEEQRQMGQAQAYGSLFQRIGRALARDFTLELERLCALVRTLQDLERQGLTTQAAAWRPHVIAVIAAVQFEVAQHTSFWTRLLHWFIPQTSEQLRESTLHLCQQAQTALGEQAQAAVGREMARLDFQQRLGRFVTEHGRAPGLFQRALPASSRQAANEMLQVCLGQVDRLSTENEARFAQDAALNPWYAGFHELFPEKLAASSASTVTPG